MVIAFVAKRKEKRSKRIMLKATRILLISNETEIINFLIRI
jgi:hypothetical protein